MQFYFFMTVAHMTWLIFNRKQHSRLPRQAENSRRCTRNSADILTHNCINTVEYSLKSYCSCLRMKSKVKRTCILPASWELRRGWRSSWYTVYCSSQQRFHLATVRFSRLNSRLVDLSFGRRFCAVQLFALSGYSSTSAALFLVWFPRWEPAKHSCCSIMAAD